ncbi:MAG TPA: methyltransferase, partial [Polyangiaceae bacterium]
LSKATQRISVNPKAALWEVEIDRGRRARLYVIPKRFDDPRFRYRVKEISGASHPTIAAALADVAAPAADDVIWDPFVGSGLELVECGLKGTYRELIGTDNDTRSLEAAAANLQAAQLGRVRLLNADARTAELPGVSVIVTNPPLGIRHRRDGMLLPLLLDFLTNARRILVPNGRLVWLSPLPQQTAQHAEQLGFSVQRRGVIDVGGLSPELQVMLAPAHRGKPWRS